ncbi:hypothetical protein [Variovorax sp. V512]
MSAVNGAGLFNGHSSGQKLPVNLTIRDTRYKEQTDGHNVVLYRPL